MQLRASLSVLLFMAVQTFAPMAQAQQAITIQDLMQLLNIFGFDVGATIECPVDVEETENMTGEQTMALGDQLMQEGEDYCEAARMYYETMRLNGTNLYTPAWRKLIQAYYMAGDNIATLNEANQYLNINRGSIHSEEIRMTILRTVDRQVKDDPRLDGTWAEYGLGLNDNQNLQNPFFFNFSYPKFMRDYPESQYTDEVKAMELKARNFIGSKYFEVGKFYFQQREFRAAIGRFQFVLRNGRQLVAFEESMYYIIMSYMEFSYALQDDFQARPDLPWWRRTIDTGLYQLGRSIYGQEITDDRLAELMQINLNSEEGAATDLNQLRQTVIQQTKAAAEKVFEQMQANLTDSEWTRKAERYMRSRQ